jgi:hypothetical protein
VILEDHVAGRLDGDAHLDALRAGEIEPLEARSCGT